MSSPAAEADGKGDWNRKFTLLWVGSATSQLGTISAATASPLLALGLDGSAVFAGWVTAASTLPGLLLNIPAGLLADRIQHRRRWMTISQGIRCLTAAILLLGLFFSWHTHVFLITAAAIDGICATFYNIIEVTAIRSIVPDAQLNWAIGKNEARHHIALVFGRPFGGFLFGLNRAFPYVFDALTSVVALAILFSFWKSEVSLSRKRSDSRIGEPIIAKPSAGWRILKKDNFLRHVLTVCTMANFLFQMVILLLVVRAKSQDYSSAEIGLLLATSGVSGFLGALVAPRVIGLFADRSLRLATFICFWLWAGLIWCVWASDHAWVGLIAWGLCSFCGAHVNVALAIYQATKVPSELLGRVVSITRFFTSGAVPLGALSAGYAIERLGVDRTALIATVSMTAIMMLMSRKGIRGVIRALGEIIWELSKSIFMRRKRILLAVTRPRNDTGGRRERPEPVKLPTRLRPRSVLISKVFGKYQGSRSAGSVR